MWMILMATAFAGEPSASLTYKGELVHLHAQAGHGEYVNEEGPIEVRAAWSDRELSYGGSGSELLEGVRLPAARGHDVSMVLELQVCTEDKTQCRMVEMNLAASVPASPRKGSVVLMQSEPTHVEPGFVASWGGGDSADQASKAMERAKAEGKLVLLDFGAVWCPPCQAMAAQVLEAPDRHDVLDNYVVATLDADDPSSFAFKSTYAIGGYPTVVLIQPDGTEVDRQVGYDTADAMIQWLTESSDGEGLEAFLSAGPDAVSPERAAEVAVQVLKQRRKEHVAAWVARAKTAPESENTRVMRLMQDATVEDATWMVEHAPERTGDWLFSAMNTLDDVPGGQAVLERAVRLQLRTADAEKSADLLYVLAKLNDDQAAAYYAGAAAALRTVMQGDAEQRKPNVGWLASLLERSGDVPGALLVLDDALKRWADEPTFHLSRGGLLLRAERYDEALISADNALQTGWGDNRLRAAKLKAEVLIKLERVDEAKKLARDELEKAARVPANLNIRTYGYRKALGAIAEGGEQEP